MSALRKYELFCQTCAATKVTDFRETVPTACPDNNTHTIVESSISCVETQELSNTYDSKQRLVVMNSMRDDLNTWAYFTSAGDDPTNGIGESSDELVVSLTTAPSVTKSIDFIEDVEVQSGGMSVQNAFVTDRFSMWVHAPATPTKAWESGMKLVKVPVGAGMNVLIPSEEGTFQFDESDGKIPIPVEAYDKNWNPEGYWDREAHPDSYGSDVYTFNPYGKGKFNFYDFAIDLGWFVNNVRVVCGPEGKCVPFSNDDPFNCYKGWQIKFMVENGNTSRTNALNACVVLRLNRKTIR